MKISKAQTMAEYSICLGAVIVVAITMMAYTRRGLQARYVDVVQLTTAQASGNTMSQYQPYYSSEDYTIAENRTYDIDSLTGGGYRTNINSDTTTREKGGISEQDINCYDD